MSAPRVGRKRWFLALARRYARRRLGKAFHAVLGSGLVRVHALAQGTPLIIAANHVAWWDPFVVVLLDALLGTESYCLMNTDNLARLPFFGWIGALPLERRSGRAALSGLHASLALADRPRRLLWIFPQGAQRRAHLRPLGLHEGVRILARESALPVVPLALDYAFAERARPLALASFGAPLRHAEAPGRAFTPALEARLCGELARIDAQVADATPNGDPFVALVGRLGPSLPLGARLLAWLGAQRRERAVPHA